MPTPNPGLTKDGVHDSLNTEAARERLNLYLQMLKSLSLLGMDLAEDVSRHTRAMLARAADGAWEPDLNKNPGSAFINLSQCVRRTIALDLFIRERLEVGAGNPFAEQVTRAMPGLAAAQFDAHPAQPKPSDLKPDIDLKPAKGEIVVAGRAAFMRELGQIHDRRQSFAKDCHRPIFQSVGEIAHDMGLQTAWMRYDPGTCLRFGQAYEPKAPWIVTPKIAVPGIPGYKVYPDRIEVMDNTEPRTS